MLGHALVRTEASNRAHGRSVQPSAPGCDASREYDYLAQTASRIRAGDGVLALAYTGELFPALEVCQHRRERLGVYCKARSTRTKERRERAPMSDLVAA
jgi:hypothetical protein